MAELIVEIPEDVEKGLEELPREELSKIALEAIRLKAFELELKQSAGMRRILVEAIASKSKLSEEEADRFAVELGREMKTGRFEKLRKLGLV